MTEQRWNPETNRMKAYMYELYETDAGEWSEKDTSMDGAMYSDIHVYRGGLEAIRDHNTRAGNRGEIWEQEDGAPGHGFNNRANGVNGAPGKATVNHAEIEKIASGKYNIKFWKQPAHSGAEPPGSGRLELHGCGGAAPVQGVHQRLRVACDGPGQALLHLGAQDRRREGDGPAGRPQDAEGAPRRRSEAYCGGYGGREVEIGL